MNVTMRFVLFTIFTLVCLSSFCIGQRYGSRWYTPYRGYSQYRGYTPRQYTPPIRRPPPSPRQPTPSPKQPTPPPRQSSPPPKPPTPSLRQFPPPPNRNPSASSRGSTCVRSAYDCINRCPCLSDFGPLPTPTLCTRPGGKCKHVDECCGCGRDLYTEQVCRDGVCMCVPNTSTTFKELALYPGDGIVPCQNKLCEKSRRVRVCDIYGVSWYSQCRATCARRKILHEGDCTDDFVFPTHRRQRPGEWCWHGNKHNECGHCLHGAEGICTTSRCRCPHPLKRTHNG